MRRAISMFSLLLAMLVPLWAQENPPQASPSGATLSVPLGASSSPSPVALPAGEATQAPGADLDSKTLRFRISSATLYELRDLAAQFGLSAEGSAEELRARLYEHFGFAPVAAPSGDVAMSIERAAGAQFFTLENGTKEIRLEGPLEIRFVDSQGSVHRISARYVVYNRDTKVVQAAGNVEYTRESKSRTDTYKGESIAFNLDDYSGVFVDGSFNMEPSSAGGRTLLVHFGTLISRSEEIIALADGSLTACDAIDPHYLLRAKKVWLFSSGDWAVANATLYIGKIPVLWLPYFYYPARASMFHPVAGFRSRTGGYLQTTTYILGQQGSDAQRSSALSVNQGALGSFGTYISQSKAAAENPDSPQLAVLADAYSSLGIFAGLRGKAAANAPATLSWLAAVGLSRSVFLESTGYYSPFDAAGAYRSVWNGWKFASLSVPVRIAADLEASSKSAGAGLSWKISLPFYSDPFVEQDFLDRNESTDFFSVFGGASATTISERTSLSQKASVTGTWRGSGKPDALSLSLNNLSAYLNWRNKYASTSGLDSTQLRLYAVDPLRHFLYPDVARPLDATVSVSQTIFRSDAASLSWTNSNSTYVEDRFYSLSWTKPQEVDFKSWYWLFGARDAANLNGSYSIAKAGLTFQATTGLAGQAQYRPYLFDERTSPTTVHPFRIADYGYSSANWSAATSAAWAPFANSKVFSASRLLYSIAGKIAKVDYQGLDGSTVDAKPIYALTWLTWDTTMITDHSVLAELAAKLGTTAERLSFKAALPPLLETYSFGASSSAGIGSLGASYILSRATATSDLTSSALTGNAVLKPSPNLRFSANASWDFQAQAPLSVSADATLLSFSARFAAQKAYGYIFKGGTWIQDGTQYFRPSTLSATWKPVLRLSPEQKNQGGVAWYLEADGSVSFSQNFIQYTNASIGTTLSFSVKNSAGLSLSLSLASLNSSAWRYYASLLPVSGELDPSLYARDFFTDLWDSLAIWNTAGLQRTLFKLQKLSLTLAVDAHDWLLSGSVYAGPTLITPSSGRPYYEMNVSFNLSVTWKDISAIKSSVTYTDGAFSQ